MSDPVWIPLSMACKRLSMRAGRPIVRLTARRWIERGILQGKVIRGKRTEGDRWYIATESIKRLTSFSTTTTLEVIKFDQIRPFFRSAVIAQKLEAEGIPVEGLIRLILGDMSDKELISKVRRLAVEKSQERKQIA